MRTRSKRFRLSTCFSLIREDSGAKSIFIPFLCRLRFLEIHTSFFDIPRHDGFNLDILAFLLDSLSISLTGTSPGILEHLEFNIFFRDGGYQVYREAHYERLRDAWSHLDSITTYSSSSQLQRVDINIEYCVGYSDDGFVARDFQFDKDKIEKAVLDGLPLLRSEGILFVNVNWGGLCN